jgi:autophagy-related protein 9
MVSRFKNYMVAMVNKSLLPVRLRVPFLGEVVFLTRGLKYNIELLLFCKELPHLHKLLTAC